MGLILDSSVLIAAERAGKNAYGTLLQVQPTIGSEDIAISTITVLELAHGAARADSAARRTSRQQFIKEIAAAIPVHPVTISIALRAGQIDGENAARGIRAALADLLIGVTALELGYGVATANLRHFELIPGLRVVRL